MTPDLDPTGRLAPLHVMHPRVTGMPGSGTPAGHLHKRIIDPIMETLPGLGIETDIVGILHGADGVRILGPEPHGIGHRVLKFSRAGATSASDTWSR